MAPTPLTPEEVSRTREGTPQLLRRRLRGDVDTIVLKALRKEPNRRYGSAEQLSDDIRRHLDGLPVLARPNTFAYRAGKFVRRHKVAVAAAAFVLVTLTGGIAVATWQARVAQAERALAEQRFNDVRKLANTFLFEFHDAVQNLPGSLPARTLVVTKALEYLENLSREASRDVSLQRELAVAYRRVGDIQGQIYASNTGRSSDALDSYTKALKLSETYARARPASVEAAQDLAISYSKVGDLLRVTGRTDRALAIYQKALAVRKQLAALQPDVAEHRYGLASIHMMLGDLMQSKGDTVGALEEHRRTLAIYEALPASSSGDIARRDAIARARYKLGVDYQVHGDLPAAEEEYRQVLTIAEALRTTQPASVDLARLFWAASGTLGGALLDEGNPRAALEPLRKALPVIEALAAAAPTDAQVQRDLGGTYTSIGDALRETGDAKGALVQHRRALEILEALAARDPSNARARYYLASTYIDLADTHRALTRLTDAYDSYSKARALCEDVAEKDSNNAEIRFTLSQAYHGLASVSEKRAVLARVGLNEKVVFWREARSWYQKDRDLWLSLQRQGATVRSTSTRPDEIALDIARCDRALETLER